jgi:hypothetical protein
VGGGKPAADRGLWSILATPLLERAIAATSTQFPGFLSHPCRAQSMPMLAGFIRFAHHTRL